MSSAAYALPQRDLVLDRYRPLRPLGRGGSGSVWLARDERTGLEVALKIVPREGKRASRAAREMEAASRLRHERCVRAYDFGGDAGHVYIAYEYVQGRTMREALRAGKLTDRASIEAAAQVLDGLAHAHRLGIVHRDVKPSNVLIEDKPELSVRLLDFGLAQFDETDTLTAVGDVPGTLAYISPERLAGGEATTASDVWAVGVLLWEALAGQHPFWGVPLPQVAAAIEAGAPPITKQRPDLAAALVEAIESALAVDPSRRPSAERLAVQLRAAVGAPRRARHVVPRPPAARRARPARAAARLPLERRLVPAGLAAATTVAAATLLPFWTPGLVLLLALAAGLAALRSPRAGLAIALFAPVFPLGNLAQAAAVAYAVVALGWLALCWRDARAGLLFAAAPILASLGALALLPLAVQPARGAARRAAHAGVGVLVAALVAGLRGAPLPPAGARVESLGLAGSTRVGDVVAAATSVLAADPAIPVAAAGLALTAALLPAARRRGLWGIAALGALQLAVVLLGAPGVPALGFVLGTWLLCGVLAAVSRASGRYP
ncbi:Protein kinase domain [Gaiella occulta]|uniref:non-specific serine/threonine protein kinase n=1 Tax=Gaiella occulta TaxID=1002870 RepID=A0A7M2YZQ0_9ACTN|nr:serine/threonine-protein kinase [Gaiella occulta]RDI75618.1 Protein kinase domain [Gaiella occulta]